MKFLEVILGGFFDAIWYICGPEDFGLAVLVLFGPYIMTIIAVLWFLLKRVYVLVHFLVTASVRYYRYLCGRHRRAVRRRVRAELRCACCSMPCMDKYVKPYNERI